jgi:hypothetical protein
LGSKSHLRDLTHLFRGRSARMPAVLRDSRLQRSVLVVVAVSLFLTAVGAFGLGQLSFNLRLGVMLVCSTVAALIGRICWKGTRHVQIDRLGWAAGPVATAALMTSPVAFLFWSATQVLHQRTDLAAIPNFLLMTFAVSITVCVVLATFTRSAIRPEQPRRLEMLPLPLREAELWAIQGEDHYVRFITSGGERLVHMRLRDAILDLKAIAGAKVHRSWWVAERGLARVVRREGRRLLVLKDGRSVPISRPYRRALRDRGWF